MAKDIWEDDLLNREMDGEFLYRLAIGRNEENVRSEKGSFVLNVDAPWGQGKSFFLDALYRTVKAKEHPAILINAWQYDFVDDPFAICVAALDRYFKSIQEQKEITKTEKFQRGLKTVRSQFLNITWTLGKAVVKKAINKVAENGVDEVATIFEVNGKSEGGEKSFADEMAEAITDEMKLFSDAAIDKFAQRQIDSINETQESLGIFQKGLGLIIEALGDSKEHKLPMFIFIDELDRCRPTYAIAMLERIKHIFDVPNVVFVIATDTESLSHSVRAVYGSEFRSREYLGRFFSRTYVLPEASSTFIIYDMLLDRRPNLQKWSLPVEGDEKSIAKFLDSTASQFDLKIRPIKQAVEMLLDITSAWDREYPIELAYMFTLICQFIKTSRLDDDELGAIMADKFVNWGFTLHGKRTNYVDLITRIRKTLLKTTKSAVTELDSLRAHDGSDITLYLHRTLFQEYQAIDDKAKNHSRVAYAKYPGLILHSRNLV